MKYFILILATLFCCSCDPAKDNNTNSQNREDAKLYPYLDRHLERAYPSEKFDVEAYIAAKEKVSTSLNTSLRNAGFELEWQSEGPENLGGRVTTIAVHPDSDDIIYLGFAVGGAYKTIDGGNTWKPIFDDSPFLAIGNIAIDKEDPNIVYLGTGDPVISSIPHLGNGLYKSIDAGETWTKSGLDEQRIISKVEIDPNNPNKIFASSQGLPFTANDTRGIYLSEDAGASWNEVYNYSDTTGFTDVTINPGNSDIVYAAAWDRTRSNKINRVTGEGSGIHLSTDGGITWTKNIPGLPQGDLCKAGISVCENSPEIVYVTYIDAERELEGLYKSRDFGLSFEPIENDLEEDVMNGFGWYFGKISVNPNDPDHLFLHSVDLYESLDGGQTWDYGAPVWFFYEVHGDMHGLTFSDDFIYLATDGGAYRRTIYGDPWSDWEDIENIPSSQFYRVAYNPHSPELIYGGMQDNGSSGGNADNTFWPRLLGGDGFQPVFNPDDPNHYFFEIQNGSIRMTRDDGENFEEVIEGIDEGRKAWDMQYIMSPHNSKTMYTATDRVYKCSDSYAPDWVSISDKLTKDVLVGNRPPNATSISESPLDEGVIYVSFNEGSIHVSTSSGDSWNNITSGLPNRFVSSVKASPDHPSWAYVTFSGYKDNDNLHYVFKTEDYGENWTDITSDLPNIAVNDIIVIPDTDDQILFIASDVGVYGSEDGGQSWKRVGTNLPMVIVYDLDYNPITKVLFAATFGKSVMSYPLDELFGLASTEHLKDSSITIGPSPANEYIEIFDNDLGADLSYQILDNNGSSLNAMTPLRTGQRIDVSSYASGIYHLRLLQDNKLIVKSFVVSH